MQSMAMPTQMEGLLRLGKSHIPAAAGVLVSAFLEYPLLRDSFAEAAQREKVASFFFRLSRYYAIRYGETYATSSNLEAVAVWIHSDHYSVPLRKAVRSVPLSVILGFGRAGGGRMKYPSAYIDAVHGRLAPFEHWYLQAIGVAPRFRGEGYASKLLRPMLARTDEEGLPCYLETVDERNVQIYEHFGFELVEKAGIPKTGLTNWAMLRQAR
jgi:ribosomal protein S18 acetylase RimI-like enzyme